MSLTKQALENGINPDDILENALIPAMSIVGNKFSRNEIYVPQMLMAAKAMSSAMVHIKPFFISGETKRKGTFIIGTVSGDLHDIGKNLVAMMIEGSGWEVIDLGVDVDTDKFLNAIRNSSRCCGGSFCSSYYHNDKYEKVRDRNKKQISSCQDIYRRCPCHPGIL